MREFFRHKEDVKAAKLAGTLDGKTVIVQGLGNVGYHAAEFLSTEDGALITGIIERDGGLWNPKGMNVQAVFDWMRANAGVDGIPYPGTFIVDRSGVIRAKLFHEGYKERHVSEQIIEAAKPIDWGAMRFLFDTLAVRKRKIEWEDLVLMAARCVLRVFGGVG